MHGQTVPDDQQLGDNLAAQMEFGDLRPLTLPRWTRKQNCHRAAARAGEPSGPLEPSFDPNQFDSDPVVSQSLATRCQARDPPIRLGLSGHSVPPPNEHESRKHRADGRLRGAAAQAAAWTLISGTASTSQSTPFMLDPRVYRHSTRHYSAR